MPLQRAIQRRFLTGIGYSRMIVLAIMGQAITMGLLVARPTELQAQADAGLVGKRVVQRQRDFALRADASKEAARAKRRRNPHISRH